MILSCEETKLYCAALYGEAEADIFTALPIYNVQDVRPILQFYQGKDIPVEYAKKEAENKKKAEEEWAIQHPTGIQGVGSGLLSSMFGSVTSVSGQFILTLRSTSLCLSITFFF